MHFRSTSLYDIANVALGYLRLNDILRLSRKLLFSASKYSEVRRVVESLPFMRRTLVAWAMKTRVHTSEKVEDL